MLLSVINPNTTAAMTDQIAAAARSVAGPGTEIIGVTPTMGPASIESHYDEAWRCQDYSMRSSGVSAAKHPPTAIWWRASAIRA